MGQKLYELVVESPFDGGYVQGYYLNKANAEADGVRWTAEYEYFIRYEYGQSCDEDRINAINVLNFYIKEKELKG